MSKKIDRTGRKYCRLTVLSEAGKNKRGDALWNCLCSCGNELIVCGHSLHSRNTRSCGCLARELTIKRKTIHGLKKHPLYSIWYDMRRRCRNKNRKSYENYGGRGIIVCPRWDKSFLHFYVWAKNNGWKKELTIDRIDNNKNYEPRNCRFITREKNTINRRLLQKNNISGYRGVSFDKDTQKYRAYINIENQRRYLGYFNDPAKAALRYDQAAKKANDERPLNFSIENG